MKKIPTIEMTVCANCALTLPDKSPNWTNHGFAIAFGVEPFSAMVCSQECAQDLHAAWDIPLPHLCQCAAFPFADHIPTSLRACLDYGHSPAAPEADLEDASLPWAEPYTDYIARKAAEQTAWDQRRQEAMDSNPSEQAFYTRLHDHLEDTGDFLGDMFRAADKVLESPAVALPAFPAPLLSGMADPSPIALWSASIAAQYPQGIPAPKQDTPFLPSSEPKVAFSCEPSMIPLLKAKNAFKRPSGVKTSSSPFGAPLTVTEQILDYSYPLLAMAGMGSVLYMVVVVCFWHLF